MDIQNMKLDLKSAQEEKEILITKLNDNELIIEKLNSELYENKNNDIKLFEEERNILHNSINEFKNKYEIAENEKTVLQNLINLHKEQNEDNKTSKENQDQKIIELALMNEKMKSRFLSFFQELDTILNNIKTEITNTYNKNETNIKNILDRLLQKLQYLNSSLQNSKEKNLNLDEVSNESIFKSINSLFLIFMDLINLLIHSINKSTNENYELQMGIQKHKEILENYTNESIMLKSENDDLKSKLQILVKDNSDLKITLDRVEIKIKEVENQNHLLEENNNRLNSKNIQLESEKANFQTKNCQIMKELENSNNQISQKEERFKIQEKDLNECKDTLEKMSSKISQVTKENERKEKRINELNENKDNFYNESQILKNVISQKEKDIEQLNLRIKNIMLENDEKIVKMKSNEKIHMDSISKLKEESLINEKHQKENQSKLLEQIKEYKTKAQTLEVSLNNEIKNKNDISEFYENEMNNSRKSILTLKEEITKSQFNISQLSTNHTKSIEKIQNNNKSLELEIFEKSKLNEDLKNDIKSYVTQIQKLEKIKVQFQNSVNFLKLESLKSSIYINPLNTSIKENNIVSTNLDKVQSNIGFKTGNIKNLSDNQIGFSHTKENKNNNNYIGNLIRRQRESNKRII